MPTYEYECKTCGHHFEKFQPMTDKPLHRCPQCGATLRRLIGIGAGVVFKGAGFHATDYGTSAAPRGAGLSAACSRARPCCGRDTPCDRSPRA